MTSQNTLFLLRVAGKVMGPLTQEEVLAAFRAGQISSETLAFPVSTHTRHRPPSDLKYWDPLRSVFPRILAEPQPKPEPDSAVIECPKCSSSLRIRPSFANGAWRCPKCSVRITVSRISNVQFRIEYEEPQSNGTKVPPKPEATKQPLSPHTILSVSATATIAEIKTAYRKRIHEYHPDKVAALGPELRALAEEKTKQIIWAFETLQKHRPRK